MRDITLEYSRWTQLALDDPDLLPELRSIAGQEEEIRDRFAIDLTFGTAGLRGILGAGTNRINIYTVRKATQGLAAYLLQTTQEASVAISYDSRIKSELFARETACVLAANGIHTYLYTALTPVPALSFAVRHLGTSAGVMVTASHNPAKYNGYKTYGNDGCQIGPVEAERISELSNQVDYFAGVQLMPLEQAVSEGLVQYIPEAFVQRYIDRVYEEAIQPEVAAKAGLKLVYTPLNGAGRRCVTTILGKMGMRDIAIVAEQEQPDGSFPTCPSPNPELKEALQLGLDLCAKTDADLLLATDPDCDRVAVAVRHQHDYQILTGNEVGVLLLDYIAATRAANGTLPANPVAVKSIVSSKLADAVAKGYGVELVDVLTGFKFIGEVILGLEQNNESERFIFGFEESCGYLSGPFVRDKDAVNASLLLVEMASAYKLAGKTLVDRLAEIYAQYGVYVNYVSSFDFDGADGMRRMDAIMETLRQHPPVDIASFAVTCVTDYQTSLKTEGGVSIAIALPKSNVLEYGLVNGCTVIVRPSGTEPKIKIYYSFVAPTDAEIPGLKAAICAYCENMIGV